MAPYVLTDRPIMRALTLTSERAMALILVITCEGRMNAGFRRQVRRRRADRLHAGFFIVRNESHRVAWRVGLF